MSGKLQKLKLTTGEVDVEAVREPASRACLASPLLLSTRSLDCRTLPLPLTFTFFVPSASPDLQLCDRLVREVASNRVRVREFFFDFDPLRSVRSVHVTHSRVPPPK